MQAFTVFVVALASIAFEVLLTRYFAIASWAEYGYWVISIAMVGYAFSGVVLALFRESASRRQQALFVIIPPLLMVTASAGYYFTATNPFNPLELQNPLLWTQQLANIGKFYLALFPFFFLSGFLIGLSFVANPDAVAQLYAADLVGAGIGAVAVLAIMTFVHPFFLVCVLPIFLSFAALANAPKGPKTARSIWPIIVLVLLAGCVAWPAYFNPARFFEYKSIYPVLHVQDNRILAEEKSPRGYYLLLDNFTERRDLPVSNNLGLMNLAGPPSAPGLYKDGNRLTAVAQNTAYDFGYLQGALSSLPYKLRPGAKALLVGSSGGFRLQEVQELGCESAVALEPDRTSYSLAANHPPVAQVTHATLLWTTPQTFLAARDQKFSLIDVAEDYLDEGPANKYSFTTEAVQRYLEALTPGGIVSLPVSIREFTVYAIKLAATVQDALEDYGVSQPANHILVYRSEWAARILVSNQPFSDSDVLTLRDFCDDYSFDTSYFPEIDPDTVEVWNDLPPVSFETEETYMFSDRAQDALRDELIVLFSSDGSRHMDASFFNLDPATDNRPYLNYIFRAGRLPQLVDKLSLVPHEEIGFLVSIAVLIQAAVFALVVVLMPAARVLRAPLGFVPIARSSIYFACLGLGFLFFEITLIEKCAYILNDSVSAFAIVLTGMLICSGLGSAFAGRFVSRPKSGLFLAVLVIVISSVFYMTLLDSTIVALLGLPYLVKCGAVLVIIGPLSFALGMPFPLGMTALSGRLLPFLPMAWAINGAFSVVSSPLANVLAVLYGYRVVFAAAMVLYPLAWVALPGGSGAANHREKDTPNASASL